MSSRERDHALAQMWLHLYTYVALFSLTGAGLLAHDFYGWSWVWYAVPIGGLVFQVIWLLVLGRRKRRSQRLSDEG